MNGWPDAFARTVEDVHGPAGREWLQNLPKLLKECEERWSFTLHSAFAPLSYNYVAPATRIDGSSIVLKAGVPHRELKSEIDALRVFDGGGAVRLFDADAEIGVLLLEHAQPGTPLSRCDDDQLATSVAIQIMKQLWRPAPAGNDFSTLTRWCAALHRSTGPLPPRLTATAKTLLAELTSAASASVLIHGDLHHENIVAAERRPWLALDPKGIVGDPAFECGAWLRNIAPQFLERATARQIIERRVGQFAEELGFERSRIVAWGFVESILSACWSVEDHGGGWEWAVFCAEILSQQLPAHL